MSKQQDNLINDILNLKNDAMVINPLENNILDFKSHIESKGLLGKVGHAFEKPANQRDMLNRAIIWIDKYLGGAKEEIS